MSYRCTVCNEAVPPSLSRKVYIIYRRDGQIEREIPVCSMCHQSLTVDGVSLQELVKQFGSRNHAKEILDKPAFKTLQLDKPTELKATKSTLRERIEPNQNCFTQTSPGVLPGYASGEYPKGW